MPSNSPEAPRAVRELLVNALAQSGADELEALGIALKVRLKQDLFSDVAKWPEQLADALLQPAPPAETCDFCDGAGIVSWDEHGEPRSAPCSCAAPPAEARGEPPKGAVCTVGNGECFEWCGDAKCIATPPANTGGEPWIEKAVADFRELLRGCHPPKDGDDIRDYASAVASDTFDNAILHDEECDANCFGDDGPLDCTCGKRKALDTLYALACRPAPDPLAHLFGNPTAQLDAIKIRPAPRYVTPQVTDAMVELGARAYHAATLKEYGARGTWETVPQKERDAYLHDVRLVLTAALTGDPS